MKYQRVIRRIIIIAVFSALFTISTSLQAHQIAVIEDTYNNILDYRRGGLPTMQNAANLFYASHPDDFDFLFIFQKVVLNLLEITGEEGYLPDAYPAARAPYGTNAPTPSATPAYFGSSGKLKLVGDMYLVDNYSSTPTEPYIYHTMDTQGSGFSQVEFVGRAMMRYWGAYVTIGGSSPNALLGGAGYWSYYLDTGGSVLGGNEWVIYTELGDNDYQMIARNNGRILSPLDLYLMGMAPRTDVAPFSYLTGRGDYAVSDPPGAEIDWLDNSGLVEVTIDQIVNANGEVNMSGAQKNFRCAFALVVAPGEGASMTDTSKLDKLRVAFQFWFERQTDWEGSINCSITGGIPDGDSDYEEPPQFCSEGQKACDIYNNIIICDADSHWVYHQSCGDLDCVDGECEDDPANVCTPGNRRCFDNKVEECRSGAAGTYWIAIDNCGLRDEICYDSECVSREEHECENTGERRCVNDIVEECQDYYAWLDIENCELEGETCSGGYCVGEADGDSSPDGDTAGPCITMADCGAGEACKRGVCIPCPDGTIPQDDRCVSTGASETEAGGGGVGCAAAGGASASVLSFLAGLLALRRGRKRR